MNRKEQRQTRTHQPMHPSKQTGKVINKYANYLYCERMVRAAKANSSPDYEVLTERSLVCDGAC